MTLRGDAAGTELSALSPHAELDTSRKTAAKKNEKYRAIILWIFIMSMHAHHKPSSSSLNPGAVYRIGVQARQLAPIDQ